MFTDMPCVVGYDLNYPVFYKQSYVLIGFYMNGFPMGVKCFGTPNTFLMLFFETEL